MQVCDDHFFDCAILAMNLLRCPVENMVEETAILVMFLILVLHSALALIGCSSSMPFGDLMKTLLISKGLSTSIITTRLLYLIELANYGRKIYGALEMRVD